MPMPPRPESPDPPQPTEGRGSEGHRSAPADATSPVGEAFAWASRILAIGLAMFLPGVGGNWLDARLGTQFLGPVGLVFGFSAALVWLVQIGNSAKPYHPKKTTRYRIPPSIDQSGKGDRK
jgi:hypothetical protein